MVAARTGVGDDHDDYRTMSSRPPFRLLFPNITNLYRLFLCSIACCDSCLILLNCVFCLLRNSTCFPFGLKNCIQSYIFATACLNISKSCIFVRRLAHHYIKLCPVFSPVFPRVEAV